MIGWYVHHHGRGHLARAAAVAPYVDEPVVVLSSLPEPATHPFDTWVSLPPDPAVPDSRDATGDGALHWAPLDSPDYAARMLVITEWLGAARPRLVVVDVSVEVTALVRLAGVPTAVVALPGRRTDDAHTLGYRLAGTILAPWPADVHRPAFLEPFASRTSFTGAFSPLDAVRTPAAPEPRTVFVLQGAGGSDVAPADLDQLHRATGWTVRGAGGALGWSDTVATGLASSQVVVTHAGSTALGEVAALRRACVVVPQPRPFDEQHEIAAALEAAGIASTVPSWPRPGEWPDLLERAAARGGDGWSRWSDGQGAQRFAAALRAS